MWELKSDYLFLSCLFLLSISISKISLATHNQAFINIYSLPSDATADQYPQGVHTHSYHIMRTVPSGASAVSEVSYNIQRRSLTERFSRPAAPKDQKAITFAHTLKNSCLHCSCESTDFISIFSLEQNPAKRYGIKITGTQSVKPPLYKVQYQWKDSPEIAPLNIPPDNVLSALFDMESTLGRYNFSNDPEGSAQSLGLPTPFQNIPTIAKQLFAITDQWEHCFIDVLFAFNCMYKIEAVFHASPGMMHAVLSGFLITPPVEQTAAGQTHAGSLFIQFTPDPASPDNNLFDQAQFSTYSSHSSAETSPQSHPLMRFNNLLNWYPENLIPVDLWEDLFDVIVVQYSDNNEDSCSSTSPEHTSTGEEQNVEATSDPDSAVNGAAGVASISSKDPIITFLLEGKLVGEMKKLFQEDPGKDNGGGAAFGAGMSGL